MFPEKKDDPSASGVNRQNVEPGPKLSENEFFRWRWTDTAGAVGVIVALLAGAIVALQALTHV